MVRFITSFSAKLFKQYAHRLTQSYSLHMHQFGNLICYSEDMTPNVSGCIEVRALDFADLRSFQMACEPTEDYRYDAGRFANKVWAMIDGSKDADDLCFWVDADCVFLRGMSDDYLRKLIPPSYYMGSFQRSSYVETGFWGVRAGHDQHKAFMDALKDVYLSGTIFKLPQWHDCFALDFTRTLFEQEGRIRAVNLTKTLNGSGTHVMATSELGRYVDHCKGARKAHGYSPENRWHKKLYESGRSPVLGVRERSGNPKVA